MGVSCLLILTLASKHFGRVGVPTKSIYTDVKFRPLTGPIALTRGWVGKTPPVSQKGYIVLTATQMMLINRFALI